MCSCTGARLPHPLFRPAPSPKLGPTLPPCPAPARRAIAAPAGAAARDDAPAPPSSFDFLALKRELEEEDEEEAVVTVEAKGGGGTVNEDDGKREAERSPGGTARRRRRQMTRRSALLAKQVISVSSARSLGFVSQLWVDANSVGYNVITSRRRNVGKGILGTQNIGGPGAEMDEYGRFWRRRRANKKGKSGGRELRRKARDPEDDWELPMDY